MSSINDLVKIQTNLLKHIQECRVMLSFLNNLPYDVQLRRRESQGKHTRWFTGNNEIKCRLSVCMSILESYNERIDCLLKGLSNSNLAFTYELNKEIDAIYEGIESTGEAVNDMLNDIINDDVYGFEFDRYVDINDIGFRIRNKSDDSNNHILHQIYDDVHYITFVPYPYSKLNEDVDANDKHNRFMDKLRHKVLQNADISECIALIEDYIKDSSDTFICNKLQNLIDNYSE